MLRWRGYRVVRSLVRWLARPRIAGSTPGLMAAQTVFVLPRRSLLDLAVLDLICARQGWPVPLSSIRLGAEQEDRRVIFLAGPAGFLGRNTMRAVPARLTRLLANPAAPTSDIALLPVQVFWGRSTNRERSLIGLLFSERWAATSHLRRLVNMLISRKHIVVDFGQPLALREAAQGEANRRGRRSARILRVRLGQQKGVVLGPNFPHRPTLLGQVVESAAVHDALEQRVRSAGDGRAYDAVRRELHEQARRAAMKMAANLSYPTVFFALWLLRAFWRRIYDGIEAHGLERIAALGRTHTLVYVPCHRSHVDYLLLSYLLFERGLMIPHIAAGENMNLPFIGGLLRRGGAFFMQRSFRDDPIHAALFSEYLYQVYRRGHCVEFFPEGGRTRTGRLLPARIGLLKTTIAHVRRGLPRPLALVPVYFGYEKLIEADSYLDELRGAEKKRESIADILRSLKLIRQDFGRVAVNFGKPLRLAEWLEARCDADAAVEATDLGREVLMRINDAASINPVNLVALTMLCTPRLAIGEGALARQIDCYLDLLRRDSPNHDFRLTGMDGTAAIAYAARLGMLNRETQDFGEVLALQPIAAVLMTWYRNNTAHALALPSLIACLLEKRRRPLARQALEQMVDLVSPYLARELHARFGPGDTARWTEHLVHTGLAVADGDQLRPAAAQSAAHYRLHLLAGIARPMLERNYIVLRLLSEPENLGASRAELLRQSQLIARKAARLHGINAPEFFDRRLFDAFIDQLVEHGAVIEDGDGGLARTDIVDAVLRAAERLIDAEYRYAVLGDIGS